MTFLAPARSVPEFRRIPYIASRGAGRRAVASIASSVASAGMAVTKLCPNDALPEWRAPEPHPARAEQAGTRTGAPDRGGSIARTTNYAWLTVRQRSLSPIASTLSVFG